MSPEPSTNFPGGQSEPQNETHKFASADLDEWRQVDLLELFRAGCLWKGFQPHYPIGFNDPAYASYILLVNAAKDGQLTVTNPGTEVDAWSLVSRRELARFAHTKGEAPEFLNDITPTVAEESEYIDLNEAATRIYEETEGTLVAHAADLPSLDRKRHALSWCAYALVGNNQQTPIFGKSPPSRIRRQIPPAEFTRCRFSDNVRALIRHAEREPKFVELEIKETDFLKRLEVIKTWSGE
ncbi:MAG: hypothetical protein IIA72_23295 [Proteobacteria bacterium]|nr:hypothetical protein [Pseudomonadota bacterium]